jgi:hypothetical protein
MALNLRFLGAAVAVGFALVAVPALAQKTPVAAVKAADVPMHPERPVVVELFSSQGCGNCPIANKNLAEMAKRSDVIALTYPVGYWDYLGWSDTFAKPEFTERQKRYNRILGHRGPYTPQVIYSGYLHGSGVNLDAVMAKFAQRDVSPYSATVAFDGDTVTVGGAMPAAAPQPATKTSAPAVTIDTKKAGVMLVRFKSGTTKITPGAGANQGKPMTYFNLVTSIEQLGEWTGGEKKFRAAKCDSGCAVLIQTGGAEGRIVGVAQKK